MSSDEAAGSRFTFCEFFAGIGGFRVALEAAGGECLLACEYCRFAQTTYRTNWPNSCIVGDIHRIAAAQVPRHDVFAAGFPCQSFSNAGRLGGFEDDRGLLFYEMLRIIRSCQPRAILLENVHGLLTRESALAEVLSCLATAGYPDVHYALLDASLLVPQRRQRCFLVGFRDPAAREAFAWPALPSLRRVVDDILEYPLGAEAPAAATLSLPVDKWRKVAQSAYFQTYSGARLLPGGAVAQTLQATYKSGCLLYSQFVPQNAVDERRAGQGCEEGCEEESAGGLADGSSGSAHTMPLPPPRFFSPRECARLMGFPEAFVLPTRPDGIVHRQMGNAVSPPLVGAIGVAVVRALEASDAARLGGSGDGGDGGGDKSGGGGGGGGAEKARRAHACAAQREAMAVALGLALGASPEGRKPQRCWLPPEALAALDVETCGRRSVGGARGDESARCGAACHVDMDLLAEIPEENRPPRVRGAAYHEELDPEWSGPYALAGLLQAARQRSQKVSCSPTSAQATAKGSWSLRLQQAQPEQTLPTPTHAVKADVAAIAMRQYLMAIAVRGD